MDPSACAASFELARLRTQSPEHNHLEEFERRRRLVKRGTLDHAVLEFARYKEFEDVGCYEDAWKALVSANEIMHALHPVDPERTRAQVNGLVGNCARHFFQLQHDVFDGPQPIFILGLPRSGATLLDRLLGSHLQVMSAGELEDFARQLCWAADQRAVLAGQMLQRLPELDYREIGRCYLAQTQWRAGAARFFIDKQP